MGVRFHETYERHLGRESCAFGKITGLVLTDDEISMKYLWRVTNECH